MISTQERDCFETADRRPVAIDIARSYVPARYTVQATPAPPPPAWTGDPNAVVAPVGIVDYVCESLSVNGHAPRPTIVSIGVVQITHRDGVRFTREGRPVTGIYVLWVGTDNPLLFARLQQLGVQTYFIPRSSYSEATVMTPPGPGRRSRSST